MKPLTRAELTAILEALGFRLAGEMDDVSQRRETYESAHRKIMNQITPKKRRRPT